MRKRLIIFVIIFLNIFVGRYLYIKAHPPLMVSGFSSYADNEWKKVIEIVNKGSSDVFLQNALVNGKEPPIHELGVSRSNHLVIGSGLDEDPNITYHPIKELAVHPKLSTEKLRILYDQKDREVIKHYGIRVIGNEIPEVITIEYRYMGILFAVHIDVRER
ncbi:hypothetical protein GCM10008967_32860 [Bacillus carboniphilus]|uniref:Uncharacterized protein n=1 Tax=Bacillus carboniphilus TaxID=86663 RepID=A0ABP3GAN6_9BACI